MGTELSATAMLQERVAERELPVEACCCPTCERRGDSQPEEPRLLQTDRGEVAWTEPAYYCRYCRRSFFPRSAELGLGVEDTVSPRVLAKIVHAGISATSFAEAHIAVRWCRYSGQSSCLVPAVSTGASSLLFLALFTND